MKLFLTAILLFIAVSPMARAQTMLPGPPAGDYPAHMFSEDFYDRVGNERKPLPGHREDRVLKKGPLAVSPLDRTLLKDFLGEHDTGLVRLFPREVTYKVASPVAQLPEVLFGGSYYSFATHSHGYGFSSDIELQRGTLSTGVVGVNYGVFANLGDVPLAAIHLQDSRVAFLANYHPARVSKDANAEKLKFGGGVEIGGMFYDSRVPPVTGTTYLLRSVVYNGEGSDVLVAFRIIREDNDQGLTIAWKLLHRYRAPHVPRERQVLRRPQPRMKWPIR
jgi:hypothetical protein